MDAQKIATQFRLSNWGEAVKERIASGQSIKAFCKEKGIGSSTYYYRQKKVREAACTELVNTQNSEDGLIPSGWARIKKSEYDTATENTLTIEVGGCRITANAETDSELLAKVCRVLRSL
jgi:putative transposase